MFVTIEQNDENKENAIWDFSKNSASQLIRSEQDRPKNQQDKLIESHKQFIHIYIYMSYLYILTF